MIVNVIVRDDIWWLDRRNWGFYTKARGNLYAIEDREAMGSQIAAETASSDDWAWKQQGRSILDVLH